jgi:hypothetical protein
MKYLGLIISLAAAGHAIEAVDGWRWVRGVWVQAWGNRLNGSVLRIRLGVVHGEAGGGCVGAGGRDEVLY